jgi:D-3-phosphoglycerate dehydrogenase
VKVLIADKFEDSGRRGMETIGCEILYNPELKDDALVDAIKTSGAEVLIVR